MLGTVSFMLLSPLSSTTHCFHITYAVVSLSLHFTLPSVDRNLVMDLIFSYHFTMGLQLQGFYKNHSKLCIRLSDHLHQRPPRSPPLRKRHFHMSWQGGYAFWSVALSLTKLHIFQRIRIFLWILNSFLIFIYLLDYCLACQRNCRII